MPDMEIDFPRGGAAEVPKKPIAQSIKTSKKRNFEDGDNKKENLQKQAKRPADDATYGHVFRKVLTVDNFTEDLRGLGSVKEIHDTNVVLECAEGIQVTVNCSRISQKFSELLSKKEVSFTLDEIFKVGQLLAFKVVKSASKEGPRHLRRPEVSIDPNAVNSHLLSGALRNGLVINGSITSIEEKGVVINLGLPSKISGFVTKEDLPPLWQSSNLRVGQVLLFRVKRDAGEATRVIRLSAYSEVDTYEDEKLNLGNLMPGTILHANPEKVVGDGVFVGLQNEQKAFLWKIHLPPRLRVDISRFAKAIRVSVLYCMPNSNILVVSAHPDIVALSKPERRAISEQYTIGEKVTGTVYSLDKQGNVLFTLEEVDGKPSLLTAKMKRVMIDDYEKNIKKYTIGSKHICRILAYHSIERLFIVSTQKEVLKQKILSSEHAKPGQKVTATIIGVKPTGLVVELGQELRGVVPKMHVLERDSGIWAKHFKTGQKITCRILFVNHETNQIILTAKPSIVNSTERIITEYSEDLIGSIAIGVIIKQHDDGGLVITFFNRVGGFLRESEVRKLTSFEIGMPLKVRIDAIDVDRERMVLSIGDEALMPEIKPKEEKAVKKEAKKITLKKSKRAKIFQLYNASIVGPWNYGGCSPETAVELDINGSVGRLHASELDLSKYEEGSVPVVEFLKKSKGKSVNVKVIQVGNHKSLSIPGRAKLMQDQGTSRFVECTTNPEKLKETRKKQSIIGYENDFAYGAQIPVFLTKFGGRSNAKLVFCEVNPLFHGFIPRERLSKIINNPAQKNAPVRSMIDISFDEGEMALGRVIGVNKTKKGKHLQISLVQVEPMEFGKEIIGRVDSIQEAPLKINLVLANGRKGILTPTSISSAFGPVEQLRSYFGYNQLLKLISWSYDEPNNEWILVTRERFKNPDQNPLIKNVSEDLKPGQILKGYVRSITEVGVFVEIAPNLLGRFKSEKEFVENDLVLVEIISASEDKIKLLYKEHIYRATPLERPPKRHRTISIDSSASVESTAEKKSRSGGYSIAIAESISKIDVNSTLKPEIQDPGFDWTLKGFNMEDMAAMGREDESNKQRKDRVKKEEDPEKQIFTKLEDLLAEKEKLICEQETEIHDTENAQSESDFDRLVTGNPNSSDLWIKYMAFFLQKKETDKARFTAERALDVIHYREEQERQNVWTAYLNLEVMLGSPESLKAVFERAIQNADSLKMHKLLAKIYTNRKMNEELNELYQSILKKFRHEDLEVWFMYGQFLLENGEVQKFRDLLQRALQSLHKTQHITILSRFASMEYKFGDVERGKTMFEKILETYPKKLHVWNLYVDMVVKYENIDETRRIFERATSTDLGSHRMKSIFKKWFEIEEKFGDENSLKMIKQKAARFVEELQEDSDKE